MKPRKHISPSGEVHTRTLSTRPQSVHLPKNIYFFIYDFNIKSNNHLSCLFRGEFGSIYEQFGVAVETKSERFREIHVWACDCWMVRKYRAKSAYTIVLLCEFYDIKYNNKSFFSSSRSSRSTHKFFEAGKRHGKQIKLIAHNVLDLICLSHSVIQQSRDGNVGKQEWANVSSLRSRLQVNGKHEKINKTLIINQIQFTLPRLND